MVVGVYADVAYITNSGRSVNYIKQIGSDTFHETQNILPELSRNTEDGYESYESIFSFRHDGKDKLLVSKHEKQIENEVKYSGKNTFMIYDMQDLSAPLASSDISSVMSYVDDITVFGSNILLAGDCVIAEINPETCEIIDQPYEFFDAEYSSYYDVAMSVHKGIICSSSYGMEYEDTGKYNEFRTMDRLGNVTGRVIGISANYIVSSGENLYIRINKSDTATDTDDIRGIYMINPADIAELEITAYDFLTNYVTKIAEGYTYSLCPDGKGGIYYASAAEEYSYPDKIEYWNGRSNSIVYAIENYESENINSYYSIGNLKYDTRNKTMFASIQEHSYAHSSLPLLVAMKQNDSGIFKIIRSLGDAYEFDSGTSIAIIESNTNLLPTAKIELLSPEDLSPETLSNIASELSISEDTLKFLTPENLSPSLEPTRAITDAIKQDGYEPVYKLNTITVNDSGYYVFAVNIPDELADSPAEDVKLYLADRTILTGSSAKSSSLAYGLLNALELDSMGVKFRTLPQKILAVAFLQAGQPFSVYLARIITAILSGGSSCMLTGASTAISLSLCAVFLMLRKK